MEDKIPKAERRSFTAKEKLALIKKWKLEKAADPTLTLYRFGPANGVNESMIRKWLTKEDSLKAIPRKDLRKSRRLPRARVGHWPMIDAKVLAWVKQRNELGLRVKDKFLIAYAKKIRDELLASEDFEGDKEALKRFQASRFWCQRFKARFGLVSRRHTTTRTLPEDYRDTAVAFIAEVHHIIEQHGISRDKIFNLDQVSK